ncbi:MAG: discoidin domain-containing protein [Oscillospiraceae bacterium]|nr:discoidin domain-containing protein [Oscillospiraceae bacterium]
MKQKRRILAALLTAAMTVSAASLPALPAQAAQTVTLSPMDTYAINNGVFEGWGTSLCWWANRLGYSDSLAQKAADAFYGDDGLRMNIMRFNIGGGDNPTHDHITRTDSNMPGYTVYNNGQVTYNWNADYNQRNVLRKCVAAAGDDAIVEMFSNSPPYYMCQSGCSTGNTNPGKNNLKDDSYTAFAEYLAEVCKHYQDEWGIKVQSVEAMNEPYTNYWGANSYKQEGCHFDIGNSESKIIVELQKAMAKRGMSDVILCGTDETSIDTQIDAYNALSGEAKAAITRIDTHTYGGSKRAQLKDVALNAGKNLWMSEVDGNGEAGTNAGAMAPGLWLAQRITTDCNNLNASAWILWQVIDKHVCAAGYNGKKDSGMPDITKGFWGVAVADHDQDKIVLSKKYYAFGQYTRYIRPGMIMLNSSGNTMAAYDKEKGQLVMVAYNTSGSASDVTFDLSQFDTVGTKAQVVRTSNSESWADLGTAALSGKALKVSLAPNSVTTYILDGVTGSTSLGEKLTPVSVSGTDSYKSDSSVGYAKAFDGSTSTFFDGLSAGWVQADLGAVYEINGFGYAPRSGYEYRCADAMFQVSDNGTDWTTVYTISGSPSSGLHVVKPTGGSVSGRYVRYAVPEGTPNNGVNKDSSYCCNIAEIEIYGAPSMLADLTEIPVASSNVTGSAAWNNSANDAKKAFDGSNTTFFDGVGDGYVQADLGGLYALDAIGFCPRKSFEARCEDGYFEISKDGVTWTKVHTIETVPGFGMHYVGLEGQEARYVRYAVPSGAPQNSDNTDDVYCCNIAEIKLYGTELKKVIGDVTADGSCNLADAVALQKYLLRVTDTVADPEAADMDGNGKLNAADLTLLKRMLLRG